MCHYKPAGSLRKLTMDSAPCCRTNHLSRFFLGESIGIDCKVVEEAVGQFLAKVLLHITLTTTVLASDQCRRFFPIQVVAFLDALQAPLQ